MTNQNRHGGHHACQVQHPHPLLAALAIVLGLFAAGCSAEDEIQAEANKEEASLLQPELDALVAAGVPGAVLVVDDPEADPIVLVSGVADVEGDRPLRAEDRFRIGSLTKSYVATVVLQLAEEENSRSTTASPSGCPDYCRTAARSPFVTCSATAAGCSSTRKTRGC